jgi:hypothetical protein
MVIGIILAVVIIIAFVAVIKSRPKKKEGKHPGGTI